MPDRKTHQQRPAANRNNSQPKYLQEYGYSYKKQQEKPSLQDIAMIQFSIEDDGKSLVALILGAGFGIGAKCPIGGLPSYTVELRIGIGGGALSRLEIFCGAQQALLRRARSVCIDFSSPRTARVSRRILAAPSWLGTTIL
jgi:hypothetical protein